MKQYLYKRLSSGWEDQEFEEKLLNLSMEMEDLGWEYYDIKITSNGNNCLVIFAQEKII